MTRPAVPEENLEEHIQRSTLPRNPPADKIPSLSRINSEKALSSGNTEKIGGVDSSIISNSDSDRIRDPDVIGSLVDSEYDEFPIKGCNN